ncbi:DUF1640 domain-containing protein [Methylobacterium sp. WL8]|nr:DUF1640 domain-containing protein [Methylobacterium sp. WL8]TXM98280.1 DUF1640 domain-containing protein [Methylobacterium sp. WL122]TXN84179.1 DUF1640 domain-containing protein [Methylobacterium sp. WL8]
MNAVAFDTLKFARSLREKAHLTPEQAEGMPDAMPEVFASGIPTKGDIVDVRHDIEALRIVTKADIEALRLSARADIATAKSDIIESMFGMIGFQTVAILGAVVALVRSLH